MILKNTVSKKIAFYILLSATLTTASKSGIMPDKSMKHIKNINEFTKNIKINNSNQVAYWSIIRRIVIFFAEYAGGEVLDRLFTIHQPSLMEKDARKVLQRLRNSDRITELDRQRIELLENSLRRLEEMIKRRPPRNKVKGWMEDFRYKLSNYQERLSNVEAQTNKNTEELDEILRVLDLKKRRFFVEGLMMAEYGNYTEDEKELGSTPSPALGPSIAIGYSRPTLHLEIRHERRGGHAISDPNGEKSLGVLRKDRTHLLGKFKLTDSPGFRFRLSYEFQNSRISSGSREDYHHTQRHVFAGGIELGGWNQTRTFGGGLWGTGIAGSFNDAFLLEDPLEAQRPIGFSEEEPTSVVSGSRFGLWMGLSSERAWWMLIGRIHYNHIIDKLTTEEKGVGATESETLYRRVSNSFGGSIGIRFLIR